MKRCHSFIFKFLNFYIVALSMATVLSLSGCIEEYEADISSEDSNLLVVEGTICSGTNTFILSRTQPLHEEYYPYLFNLFNSGTYPFYGPQMVWGATVSIRGNDGSEYCTYADGGYYTCWIDVLSPDVEYYLHIEADGEVYESEPQKPLPTERITDVCGVQNTPESNIDVLVTPAEPFESDKTNYYLWTCDETWEVHPECTTILYFDTEKMGPVVKRNQFPERGWMDATSSTIMVGSSSNYDGQHIQRLKLFDINRSDERMYYKYSGLVHQRAISKAEYEYELARRQAGSEMGGLFTPLPSALPTNIHCLTSSKHVIGFVGCSLNTSNYRFFLHAEDFTIYSPYQYDARLWNVDPTDTELCRLADNGMFLCDWIDPIKSSDGRLHTAWAFEYQLDVRCRGAYVEEPYFWSQDENEEDKHNEDKEDEWQDSSTNSSDPNYPK